MRLAPICLFTYNRLQATKQTIASLQQNYLAMESELIIYSDGPANQAAVAKVEQVRSYLKTVDGFKKITLINSQNNKGLAASVIGGVSRVLEEFDSVIVLEDDLVTAPNFLDFMNQAIQFYKNDERILSISGYTLDLPSLPGKRDFYFGYRASSWGWATWKDRWEKVDWELSLIHI